VAGSLVHSLFSDFETQLGKGDSSLLVSCGASFSPRPISRDLRHVQDLHSVLCPAKAASLLPSLELSLG